jgi:hypothetical protein
MNPNLTLKEKPTWGQIYHLLRKKALNYRYLYMPCQALHLKQKTFPLFVYIGNVKLVALLDSDSTTTFIDPSVVLRTNLPVINHKPIKVTVANGNTLWTQTVTPVCQYTNAPATFQTLMNQVLQ